MLTRHSLFKNNFKNKIKSVQLKFYNTVMSRPLPDNMGFIMKVKHPKVEVKPDILLNLAVYKEKVLLEPNEKEEFLHEIKELSIDIQAIKIVEKCKTLNSKMLEKGLIEADAKTLLLEGAAQAGNYVNMVESIINANPDKVIFLVCATVMSPSMKSELFKGNSPKGLVPGHISCYTQTGTWISHSNRYKKDDLPVEQSVVLYNDILNSIKYNNLTSTYLVALDKSLFFQKGEDYDIKVAEGKRVMRPFHVYPPIAKIPSDNCTTGLIRIYLPNSNKSMPVNPTLGMRALIIELFEKKYYLDSNMDFATFTNRQDVLYNTLEETGLNRLLDEINTEEEKERLNQSPTILQENSQEEESPPSSDKNLSQP